MKSEFTQALTELVNSSLSFTDIRIELDSPVAIKAPQGWVKADIAAPTIDDISEILGAVESNWEEKFDNKEAINRPWVMGDWRIRINAFRLAGGGNMAIVLRRIKNTPPDIREVGLPGVTRVMLTAAKGLILISGSTRSGKTTSAAAMLDAINKARPAHIITIEDPIEYVHQPIRSVISQREVGCDTTSFNAGLEDALRQCPDVILVGEIRNRETAETTLLASESGHLVIGTLHANSAIGATQKMLAWFNDNERAAKAQTLAANLIGVVHQVLLPLKSGDGYALATEIMNNSEQDFSPLIGNVSVEKLQNAMESESTRKGSITLAESLADLANRDVVPQVEVIRAAAGSGTTQEKLKSLLKM